MPDLSPFWHRRFDCKVGAARFSGITYFHWTACCGTRDAIDWLYYIGLVHHVNETVGHDRVTALFLAVYRGNDEAIDFLLSKGAYTSIRSALDRRTPLHGAAEMGNIYGIRALLKNGDDVCATDTDLHTLALKSGHDAAAKILRDHYVACNISNWRSQINTMVLPSHLQSTSMSLLIASQNGRLDIIQELLHAGAEINAGGERCQIPVMVSAGAGHLDLLDLFRERGANYMARDILGCSALHYACRSGKSLVIPGLLEIRLSLTEPNFDGCPPLRDAIIQYSGSLPVLVRANTSITELSASEILLLIEEAAFTVRSNRAFVWILDQSNVSQVSEALEISIRGRGTVLHIAAGLDKIEIMDALINVGSDIDCWTPRTRSLLIHAAMMNRMEPVQLLARRGAKLEHMLPDGRRISAIDESRDYPEIQHWLREFYEESKHTVSDAPGL